MYLRMRESSVYVVAIAAALAVIAGTAIFLHSSSTGSTLEPTAERIEKTGKTSLPKNQDERGENNEPSAPKAALKKVTVDIQPPANAEEFLSALREIMPDTNLHRQRKALLDLMEHLTPEAAPLVREAFFELKKAGFTSEFGWWSFCTRWGEIDPEGAFKYFSERPDDPGRGNVASHLMEGWMAVDAHGARTWLADHRDSPFFREAFGSYIKNSARTNLSQATRDVFALAPDSDTLWHNLGPLVESARTSGQMEGVTSWFDGLTDTEKSAAFEHALWAFKDADLFTAVEWFTQNADKPWRNDKHFHHIANRFAQQDPRAALDWVITLPDDPGRPGFPPGLSTILDTWTQKEPDAAAAWLEQNLSAPWLPRAAMGHLRTLRRIDQGKADAFLARIPAEMRAAVLQQMDGN